MSLLFGQYLWDTLYNIIYLTLPRGNAQRCPEEIPGGNARRKCPEEMPRENARRKCTEDMLGGNARKKCPEEMPGGFFHFPPGTSRHAWRKAAMSNLLPSVM